MRQGLTPSRPGCLLAKSFTASINSKVGSWLNWHACSRPTWCLWLGAVERSFAKLCPRLTVAIIVGMSVQVNGFGVSPWLDTGGQPVNAATSLLQTPMTVDRKCYSCGMTLLKSGTKQALHTWASVA